MTKPKLEFRDLTRRLKALELPPADLVVGIATGGIVPASLVAFHLDVPLELMSINFRDAMNQPQRTDPELLAPFSGQGSGQRILLVDDVSVTGRTLEVARAQLLEHSVTTLVLKGKADFVLLPEISSCVIWPWS
jgi:hypoxanthine phosphoribosyltransferase